MSQANSARWVKQELMSAREKGCRGKAIPFTNPGIANFDKYKFENELSSVRCDFIWGWPKKRG